MEEPQNLKALTRPFPLIKTQKTENEDDPKSRHPHQGISNIDDIIQMHNFTLSDSKQNHR